MESNDESNKRKDGYRVAIIELIRSYSTYYRAKANQTDKALPNEEIRWARCTAIGTWSAAILAGFAAVIFWGQWDTAQKANNNAERAWLASVPPPLFLVHNHEGIQTFINFVSLRNIGKEPAFEATVHQRTEFIYPPSNPDAVGDSDENICTENPKFEFGSIFPSDKPIPATAGMQKPVPVSLYIRDRIMVVRGCFTYLTLKKRHFTRYCYFLSPRDGLPVSKWTWMQCAGGFQNFAN